MYDIDPRSGIPIYLQLKERIRHEITSGRLGPGARLPTVRELAVQLTINANTVSRVYSELQKEGYLETRQGSGTYVREVGSGLRQERKDRLRELIREIVSEGLNLGYSREQLLDELRVEVARVLGERTRDGPGDGGGVEAGAEELSPKDKEGSP